MATVSKRGNLYSLRYYYETETGEIKQKRVSGFKSEADAWAASKELEAKSEAGIEVNGGNITCAELMEQWFAARKRKWAPTTLAKYSAGIDKLSKTFIADIKVKKINPKLYNKLMDDLMEKVEARTAITDTEPLRRAFTWAWQEKMIPFNPLINLVQPTIKQSEKIILSEEDVQELVDTISSKPNRNDFKVPLLLALYGGLRREECAGLRWEDVDFKKNSITISGVIVMTPDGKEHEKDPKTKLSRRTISMPNWIMDILKVRHETFLKMSNSDMSRLNPDHRVCVTSTGVPYSCKSYAHAIIRLIREINEKREKKHLPRMPQASFHDLRHTHAAMCIRLGIQPKVIQERLGHASIKITMDLYGYLMPGMQESVADAFNKEYQDRQTAQSNMTMKEAGIPFNITEITEVYSPAI